MAEVEETVPMSQFNAMISEMQNLANEHDLAQETITDLVLAMDSIGWKPFGADVNDPASGPTGIEIVAMSKRLRTLLAGNPMATRGVAARTGYIWGQGVEISVEGAKQAQQKGAAVKSPDGKTKLPPPPKVRNDGVPTILKANDRTLFSPRARQELEAAAATDGNVFCLLDPKTKRVTRIPIGEITATVRDPDDRERVNFYQRSWTRFGVDNKGSSQQVQMKVWYPAWDFDDTAPTSIDSVKVDKSKSIILAAFNTQSHWVYGMPDLFPVVWYLASYKEYMEAGFSVTKALAKFAIKTISPNKTAASRVAAAVASPTDPTAKGASGYGNLADAYGGADIQAISKAGAEFDFDSGEAIAALVAAGLGLTVDVLLAKAPGAGEVNLGEATVKSMIGRQQEWDWLFTSIFTYFGTKTITVTFPPVRTVPVHRAIQAVVMAAATNTLTATEIRGMMVSLLGEYGIEDEGVLPEKGAWVEFTTGLNPQAQADQAAQATKDALAASTQAKTPGSTTGGDLNHPKTSPIQTPTNGVKSAGPTSDGDHSQRKSQ